MTNLDRLRGSGFLFDNLISFIDTWGEKFLNSGSFKKADHPLSFSFPSEFPEPLRQFYELRHRWPFLELGDHCRILDEPVFGDSGLIIFSSGFNAMATTWNGDHWELWKGKEKETWPDDDTVIDFGPPAWESKIRLPQRLDDVLTEIVLDSISAHPWILTPGISPLWNPLRNGALLLKTLFNEAMQVFDLGSEDLQWSRPTLVQSKSWKYHPEGIVFKQESQNWRQGVPSSDPLEVDLLYISVNNSSIRSRLQRDGCLARKVTT